MQNFDLSSAQLVVARYDEDLRWLDALPQVSAVVYNRGDNAAGMLPRPRANLQILKQENNGREDQELRLLTANGSLAGLSQAHLRELLQPLRGAARVFIPFRRNISLLGDSSPYILYRVYRATVCPSSQAALAAAGHGVPSRLALGPLPWLLPGCPELSSF